MIRRTTRHLFAIAAGFLTAATCSASPVDTFTVSALVDRADVIVVGKVVSLVDGGTEGADGPVSYGAIEVDSVVKGPPLGIVKFAATRDVQVYATPAGECRAFFLLNGGGDFRFVKAFNAASVVAACGAEPAQTQDPLERVTHALGRAAGSRQLQPDVRVAAIFDLGSASPSVARTYLRRLLRDVDRQVQLSAATVLLRLGDVTALMLAESVLLEPDLDLARDADASNLRYGLRDAVCGAAAVPALIRLAAAPSKEVRVAAATALGRTKADEAIPLLARALDDPELEVRYAAVQAFAELASAPPERKVSLEEFRESPDRHLAYWREWAAARAR